jgi:gliding motility-associated lipoprotein GldH
MLRSKLYIILSAITVASALASCNRKTVYDQYGHTPLAGWERNDTLSFAVRPMENDGVFKEEVGLRINDSYPFMDLCLIVEQTVFPANITRSDTLNCKLVDSNGKAKGKGLSYYQFNFHLTDLQLVKGDSLHVSIRHNMKREILPGIADIGLRLSRK